MFGRDVQHVQRRAEDGEGERSPAEDGCAPIESPCALAIEEAAPDDKGESEEEVRGCVADVCACGSDVFDRVVWMELQELEGAGGEYDWYYVIKVIGLSDLGGRMKELTKTYID